MGLFIHHSQDPAAGPIDHVQVSIIFVIIIVFVITHGNLFVNLPSCNCRFVLGRFEITLPEP